MSRKRISIEELNLQYKNKKIDMLTILEIFKAPVLHTTSNKEYMYTYAKCLCECGTLCNILLTTIENSPYTKSCGYHKIISIRENIKKANEKPVERKLNRYFFIDPYCYLIGVELSNTKNIAIVDSATWNTLKYLTWGEDTNGYMSTDINGYSFRYHVVILSCPPNLIRDHINRNKLDNTYGNLRVITQTDNLINTTISQNNHSGYKGIIINESNYIAFLNKKDIRLSKTFKTLEEAIAQRQIWEQEYFQIIPIETPKLFLFNGCINPYFRFDWYDEKYKYFWKFIGIN